MFRNNLKGTSSLKTNNKNEFLKKITGNKAFQVMSIVGMLASAPSFGQEQTSVSSKNSINLSIDTIKKDQNKLNTVLDSVSVSNTLDNISKEYGLSSELSTPEFREKIFNNVFGIKDQYKKNESQNNLLNYLLKAFLINDKDALIKSLKEVSPISVSNTSDFIKELMSKKSISEAEIEKYQSLLNSERQENSKKIETLENELQLKQQTIEAQQQQIDELNKQLLQASIETGAQISDVNLEQNVGEKISLNDENFNELTSKEKFEQLISQQESVIAEKEKTIADLTQKLAQINAAGINATSNGVTYSVDGTSVTLDGVSKLVSVSDATLLGNSQLNVSASQGFDGNDSQNAKAELSGKNYKIDVSAIMNNLTDPELKVSLAYLWAGAQAGTYVGIQSNSNLEKLMLSHSIGLKNGKIKLSAAVIQKIIDANFSDYGITKEVEMSQNAFGIDYEKALTSSKFLKELSASLIFYSSEGKDLGYIKDIIVDNNSLYSWTKGYGAVVGGDKIMASAKAVLKINDKIKLEPSFDLYQTTYDGAYDTAKSSKTGVGVDVLGTYRINDKNVVSANIGINEGTTVGVKYDRYLNNGGNISAKIESKTGYEAVKDDVIYSLGYTHTFGGGVNNAPTLLNPKNNALNLGNIAVNTKVATDDIISKIITKQEHIISVDKTGYDVEKNADGTLKSITLINSGVDLATVESVTPSEYASYFSIENGQLVITHPEQLAAPATYDVLLKDINGTYTLFQFETTKGSVNFLKKPDIINSLTTIIATAIKNGTLESKYLTGLLDGSLKVNTVDSVLTGGVNSGIITHYLAGTYSNKVLNGVVDGVFNSTQLAAIAAGTMDNSVAEYFVENPNFAPTNITITSTTVAEGLSSGSIVGTLMSVDANTGDTFTYELVDQNIAGAFAINGNKLVISDASVFNYDINKSATVTVKTTDISGSTYEKTLTINITGVETALASTTYALTTPTNGVNRVTLTFNKDIPDSGIASGWTKVNSKTFYKDYSVNTQETIDFIDAGGETVSANINVNNIFSVSVDPAFTIPGGFDTTINSDNAGTIQVSGLEGYDFYLYKYLDGNLVSITNMGTFDSNNLLQVNINTTGADGSYTFNGRIKYDTNSYSAFTSNLSITKDTQISDTTVSPEGPSTLTDYCTESIYGDEGDLVYIQGEYKGKIENGKFDYTFTSLSVGSNEFNILRYDESENVSKPYTLTINRLDNTPPDAPASLTLTDADLGADAGYTNNKTVTINIPSSNGAVSYKIFGDVENEVTTSQNTLQIDLSAGDGVKVVKVVSISAAGFESTTYASSSIYLDRIAPTYIGSDLSNVTNVGQSTSATVTYNEPVNFVSGTFVNNLYSDIGGTVSYSSGNGTPTIAYTLGTPNVVGNAYIKTVIKDKAGNNATLYTSSVNLAIDYNANFVANGNILTWNPIAGATEYFITCDSQNIMLWGTISDLTSPYNMTGLPVLPNVGENIKISAKIAGTWYLVDTAVYNGAN